MHDRDPPSTYPYVVILLLLIQSHFSLLFLSPPPHNSITKRPCPTTPSGTPSKPRPPKSSIRWAYTSRIASSAIRGYSPPSGYSRSSEYGATSDGHYPRRAARHGRSSSHRTAPTPNGCWRRSHSHCRRSDHCHRRRPPSSGLRWTTMTIAVVDRRTTTASRRRPRPPTRCGRSSRQYATFCRGGTTPRRRRRRHRRPRVVVGAPFGRSHPRARPNWPSASASLTVRGNARY